MTINQNAARRGVALAQLQYFQRRHRQFRQPDSNSVALNRIYQNGASEILGHLNANSRVYLLNQNGIMFGNGAGGERRRPDRDLIGFVEPGARRRR